MKKTPRNANKRYQPSHRPYITKGAVQQYSTSAVHILKLVMYTGVQCVQAVVVRHTKFRILTGCIFVS